MFDSKNANLIVWVLSAWLALVETACGQEASGTEQAEPDSGRPLPRAVFIDLPQPIIDDQDPVWPSIPSSRFTITILKSRSTIPIAVNP